MDAVFVTLTNSPGDRARVRLLIESIRAFGGPMRHLPVWLFRTDSSFIPYKEPEARNVRVLELHVPDAMKTYPFAGKVFACAQAEELASSNVDSLVWLSSDCLIIRPPPLFALSAGMDAAFRPVHIKNIGLFADENLDGYWRRIYNTLGVKDVEVTVESFVDRARIRAYYNSHAFAVNPSRKLLRQWIKYYGTLVSDQEFQSGSCKDMRHRVFLHQAILSALTNVSLDNQRIRTLPPDYIYPYNLHQSIAPGRRATILNDLVCIAYENRPLHPTLVNDIRIDEPLRSWLITHLSQDSADPV